MQTQVWHRVMSPTQFTSKRNQLTFCENLFYQINFFLFQFTILQFSAEIDNSIEESWKIDVSVPSFFTTVFLLLHSICQNKMKLKTLKLKSGFEEIYLQTVTAGIINLSFEYKQGKLQLYLRWTWVENLVVCSCKILCKTVYGVSQKNPKKGRPFCAFLNFYYKSFLIWLWRF